jgi:cytoskeletal protein CcmA (bactofilin family)
MSEDARENLNCSGVQTIPGGKYNQVNFSGVVKVDGDLDCIELRSDGVFRVAGSVRSNAGWMNGSAHVNADFRSDTIDVSGDIRVDGSMFVDSITTDGRLVVKGSVKSENIVASGQVKVEGDCSSETFDLKGAFTVEDTLNAGDLNAHIYWSSSAKDICGEKIHVKKGRDNNLIDAFAVLLNPLNFYKAQLKVETIEGDDIELEQTTAKVVRGNTVIIGDGCKIDLVEYKDNFKMVPKASVGKYVKV